MTYWNETFENRYIEIKNDPEHLPLKVILMPHSHNDPGWLRTYEEYYMEQTSKILDNMVENLDKYRNMTFIWAEMSFLSLWWDSPKTKPDMKELFKKLIARGQLEIVTGGWVMTDEAVAHYYDMIDQLIEGHQFLKTSVGLREHPTTGWSIDPFGHGMTFPYILQKSGITNSWIQRTHFGWKQHLAAKQQLEFVWKQSFNTKQSKYNQDLFCHMTPFEIYSFKFTCGPDTNICLQYDFSNNIGTRSTPITDQNVAAKSRQLIDQYARHGSLFKHNTILIQLGDDFRYESSTEWEQQFVNYNKLIEHINANPIEYNNTEVVFGTLDVYFREVHQRMRLLNQTVYPTLYGDFMPYADVYCESKYGYWTGFYTTRPYLKALSRELQHCLRSAEILFTLASNLLHEQVKNYNVTQQLGKDYQALSRARRHLALFQHHDAITGTSKAYVMQDYGIKLHSGINDALDVMSSAVQYLLFKEISVAMDPNAKVKYLLPGTKRTDWGKLSQKVVIDSTVDDQEIIVFNSHIQPRIEVITILVNYPGLRVFDGLTGEQVQIQAIPYFDLTTFDKKPARSYEISFYAILSPISLKTFKLKNYHINNKLPVSSKVSIYINDTQSDHLGLSYYNFSEKLVRVQKEYELDYYELETPYLTVRFNKSTGLLTHIFNKRNGLLQKTQLSLITYTAIARDSGAYLFRKSKLDLLSNVTHITPHIRIITGLLSSELTVIYSDFLELQFKVYNTSAPIGGAVQLNCKFDVSKRLDLNSRELVLRIETDIDSIETTSGQNRFYVDSNGYQMIERRYIDELGIEANYYPMTSALYIEDVKSRFTVVASHAHGVSSSMAGAVEVMVERKVTPELYWPVNRGLAEGVKDQRLTVSRFWIGIEDIDESIANETSIIPNLSQLMYSLLITLLYEPNVLVNKVSTNSPKPAIHTGLTFLETSFDCNLFLVNFRTLPNVNDFNLPSNSSLLLVHNRGQSCRVKQVITPSALLCAQPKNNIKTFSHLNVKSINECSLTGIQAMDDLGDLSDINVPEMQINAYNISFG